MNKFEKFKEKFISKRAEIIQRSLKRAADNESLDTGGDEGDIVQMATMKNLSDRLSGQEQNMVNSIDKALLRLEQGVYGICEECEDVIAVPRLEALPYCTLCISCAEEQEMTVKR